MKKKSIITSIISLALIFSTVGSVSASERAPEPKPITSVQNLITSDGIDMGSVTINTSVEFNNTKEGVEFTVTTDSDYTLNDDFASIKEYRDEFSDGVTVNTYLITKDNELYANGELLDNPFTSLKDAGGIPAISHYYDNNDYTHYTFNSYSDISVDWTADIRPDGSHVSKSTTTSNNMFYSAKSSVDSFANNYNNYVFYVKSAMVLAGITAISWPTLLGLVGAGSAAAVQAASAVNSYNSAKSDVGRAYNYINQF